jgi:uncharacterized cupin superfamily protein
MPKLRADQWQRRAGAVNRLTGENNGPYGELVLGDQAQLTQFGVHLAELAPGSRSSHRHWHETEDEFVYVLSGELVLATSAPRSQVEAVFSRGRSSCRPAGVISTARPAARRTHPALVKCW